jgi:hypothetical protein
MYQFYAQLTATQLSSNSLFAMLAKLMRLNRYQMRALAGDQVWNGWGA